MAIATALARSRRLQCGLAMVALVAAMASIGAQSPQTASISGRVVDGVTGQPVSHANVSLSPRSGGSIGPILSDIDGHFTFTSLKPDAYVVVVVAAGYLPSSRTRLVDRTTMWIDVAAAESIQRVQVALDRATLVSGEVLGESAELIDATVIAFRPTVRSGLSFQMVGQAVVDADGRFQLARLTPGSYIFALRRNTKMVPLTFFANAEVPSSALRVEVKAGDHIQVPSWDLAKAEGYSISGKLLDDGGIPIAGAQIRLSSAQHADLTDVALAEATTNSSGLFLFSHVLPGAYVAQFVGLPPSLGTRDQLAPTERRGFLSGKPLAPTSEKPTFWASSPISVVDRSVDDLTLRSERGNRIRAMARFRGAGVVPDAVALSSNALYFRQIGALPTDFPGARFESDGTATTIELPRGEYAVGLAGSFPGWSLESVTAGGREILGRTFESSIGEILLSFGDTPTQLFGVVRDNRGFPAPGAVVYVLSTERSDWRVVGLGGARVFSVQTDRDGRFECEPIAGEYSVVAAASGSLPPHLLTPSALDALVARAKRVSVSRGKSASIELTAPR